MQNLNLQWKEFQVGLEAIKVKIDLLAPEKCYGLSANL